MEYTTKDLTVEAYQLGSASPPAWYTTLIESKDIIAVPQNTERYTVLTTEAGVLPARNGDYVIYEATVFSEVTEEEPVPIPVTQASLRLMSKADFEATYDEAAP